MKRKNIKLNLELVVYLENPHNVHRILCGILDRLKQSPGQYCCGICYYFRLVLSEDTPFKITPINPVHNGYLKLLGLKRPFSSHFRSDGFWYPRTLEGKQKRIRKVEKALARITKLLQKPIHSI